MLCLLLLPAVKAGLARVSLCMGCLPEVELFICFPEDEKDRDVRHQEL